MLRIESLPINPIRVTVSLQEKKSNYYAVMQYKNNDGKKQYVWRTTKVKVKKGNRRKAEQRANDIKQQFEQELNKTSLDINNEDILLSDYLLEWLDKVKTQVEITTYSAYERNTKRMANYFKDTGITLGQLRTKHIQQFYTYLQQTYNIKWNTVKRYHANLHKALEEAITLELIDHNPASAVKHQKVEQYIASYYNEIELKNLFEIAKGDLIEPIILVASYYGLRKSEVLGLKWDAIDFENKTITIKHTVTNASVRGKTILVEKKRTKNKSSYRTLPLVEEIEEVLLTEMSKQEENRKFFGNTYMNEDNYIFTTEEGALIKPDRVSRRFKRLLKDNNLRDIRFHDLRHSCATLLLSKGISLEDIQVWLGHSSITTTELYSNNEVLNKIASADTIANALKRSA